MDCANCKQPVEAGAAFCGNCGQPLASSGDAPSTKGQTSSIAQVWANQAAAMPQAALRPGRLAVAAALPSYAIPVVSEQHGEIRAGMSLVAGVLGVAGSLLIPLLGLALGVGGLMLGTMSRHTFKRGVSTAGIICSSAAVLIGLGSWVLAVTHDPRFSHQAANVNSPSSVSTPAVSARDLTTPCYSVGFTAPLNVQNSNGSCNMNAFNGDTLSDSSNAYKVYGTVSAVSPAAFMELAKQAIESDVRQTLPSFTIHSETSGLFAGSPAYFVTTSNGAGVSLVEAAALHTTTSGDNFFVFVHAQSGSSASLDNLQARWQWQ